MKSKTKQKQKQKFKPKQKQKQKQKQHFKQSQTAAAAADALDMRITTHGKIESYVAHITARLAAAAATATAAATTRPLFVYAEGPAVAKLVSVVEIAKRRRPGSTVCELSCGNTRSSPCPLKAPPHAAAAATTGSADDAVVAADTAAKGIYAARAFAADPAGGSSSQTPDPSPGARPKESVWLLAKLTC
ncbi:hypothetical protein LPJ53_001960 [Coemansia erecta]|uniref:DNA/RNA-binding protein Alba-like domain-containing protein n=1 Tax=Coemansia erecta TaxID=147472 RepID=A0A9W7Y5A8_9FUNG|nr:hypothetical protein LPJ53_001960 [Coemansia erecta]